MQEEDDKFLMANKLVLLIPTVVAVLMYAKAVHDYVNFVPSEGVIFDYSYTKYAICLTIFVWLLNYIHVDKFDERNDSAPLGGNI